MARNTDTVFNTSGTTSSFNSSDFRGFIPAKEFDHQPKGGIFYLTATENSGTATVDVKLQAKSPNGTYFDIPGAAFAQVSATGSQMLTLYPGIAETANVSVSDLLPDNFRAVATVGGTGNYDLRLDVEYIL